MSDMVKHERMSEAFGCLAYTCVDAPRDMVYIMNQGTEAQAIVVASVEAGDQLAIAAEKIKEMLSPLEMLKEIGAADGMPTRKAGSDDAAGGS
jgi:hypothetical protein